MLWQRILRRLVIWILLEREKSVGHKKKAVEEKGIDGMENDERGESNQEKENK